MLSRVRFSRGNVSATALVLSFLGWLAFAGVPAQAAISHRYLSQLTGFGNPTGIAFDAAGDVYVVDTAAKTVDRFTSGGAPLAFSESGSYIEGSKLKGTPTGPGGSLVAFAEPDGVAVNDENGEVYVADGAAHVVDVFSSTGKYLSQLTGTPASAPTTGPFEHPYGLTVDQSTHDLYVTDTGGGARSTVVDVFSSTGTYVSQFGEGLFGNKYGESVAVNVLTEDVYVGDSQSDQVFVFDSAGSFVPPEWGGTGTPQGSFGGEYVYVGLDQSSGHVYVAQTQGNVVDEFGASASEEYVSQVTGTPTGPGGSLVAFSRPQAVAVNPASGDLYVADSSGVMDVFGPDIVVPDVTTGAASSVTETSATLEGVVNPDETSVSGCEFEYRTRGEVSFTHTVACAQPLPLTGKEPVPVSANPTGLSANTTYEYRLLAINTNGANQGSVRSFTTTGPPTIDTESYSVGPTRVTLSAQINPDGLATHYHFEYGPTTSYGTSVPIPDGEIPAGFSEQAVSVNVTGLQPSTTYHFRVVASNTGGPPVDGADQTFTTEPPLLIDSESVSNVAATSATLEAQVNPQGNETSAYFQYGTASCTTSPASCTDVPIAPGTDLGSAEGDQLLSEHLQDLTPDTTYYYRVIATNTFKTLDGPDETFTTQPAGSEFTLPDNREWELVSPPDKYGAGIFALGFEEGATIQAAVGGGAVAYAMNGPIAGSPSGNKAPEDTEVLSRRGPGGWESQDIATPDNEEYLRVGQDDEYFFFSADLSLAVVDRSGRRALPPLPEGSQWTPYLRRNLSGEYEPLLTTANTLPGSVYGENPGESEVVGVAPDLSHLVIGGKGGLTSGVEGGLYEWAGGVLQPINVLPDGKVGALVLGGQSQGPGLSARHAVSNDGSRVVLEEGDPGPLYLRDVTRKETVPVSPGEGEFQAASSDGSRVFFTEGGELYVFEVTSSPDEALAGKVVDLTGGKSSGVKGGILGASEDGSYVYFVAEGVIGDGAEYGAEPGTCEDLGVPSESRRCNLYVEHYDGTEWGAPHFIAALSREDEPDWEIFSLIRQPTRVSPNGRYLAFMSERSLTGYDNRDARSGESDEEVFLYDADAGRLVCASCNPTGARPAGVLDRYEYPGILVDNSQIWSERWIAANIPGWTNASVDGATYQSRYLSNSGRLFFDSSDALVPADVDGTQDVYEYEPAGVGSCESPGYGGSASDVFSEPAGGCVALISSGISGEESAFLDASEGGGEVFFMTSARLAPQDYDNAYDVYDAHECTSESPCLPAPALIPPPCSTGDACKPAPTPQPGIFGAPSSETFSGAGNIVPSASPTVVTPSSPTRAQKLAKALKACRKKPKRKRAGCESQARKRYGAKKSKTGKSLSVQAGR